MKKFLTSNETSYRFLRTIVQVIIGFIISYIDVLLGFTTFEPIARPIIAELVVLLLTAIMGFMGDKDGTV